MLYDFGLHFDHEIDPSFIYLGGYKRICNTLEQTRLGRKSRRDACNTGRSSSATTPFGSAQRYNHMAKVEIKSESEIAPGERRTRHLPLEELTCCAEAALPGVELKSQMPPLDPSAELASRVRPFANCL